MSTATTNAPAIVPLSTAVATIPIVLRQRYLVRQHDGKTVEAQITARRQTGGPPTATEMRQLGKGGRAMFNMLMTAAKDIDLPKAPPSIEYKAVCGGWNHYENCPDYQWIKPEDVLESLGPVARPPRTFTKIGHAPVLLNHWYRVRTPKHWAMARDKKTLVAQIKSRLSNGYRVYFVYEDQGSIADGTCFVRAEDVLKEIPAEEAVKIRN